MHIARDHIRIPEEISPPPPRVLLPPPPYYKIEEYLPQRIPLFFNHTL